MKFGLPIKFEKLERMDKSQYRTVVVGLLALIILMGVAGYLAFLVSLRGEEQVMVPDVVGLDLAQACVKLQEKELYPRVNLRTTSLADVNQVLEQSPQQGMIVKAGRRIELVVSRGAVVGKVENYVGQGIEDVRLRIQNMFINQRPLLVVVDPIYKKDAKIPAGIIVEQQPVAGTEINGVTNLKFVVSTGPEDATVIAPKLEGLSIADALAKIESTNIAFMFVARPAEGKEKAGTVVTASVAGGTKIPADQVVEITVTAPAKADGLANGIYQYQLDSYPIPVRIMVRAVLPSGEEQRILTVRNRGGFFTIPYNLPLGSVVILSVSGKDLDRMEVK
jgi:beta-lactam-binding protein with PASTA domain